MEASEIVMGLQNKSLSLDRIKDLPEMLASKSTWRKHPDNVLLFKAVGVGLSDLVVAQLAVNKLI